MKEAWRSVRACAWVCCFACCAILFAVTFVGRLPGSKAVNTVGYREYTIGYREYVYAGFVCRLATRVKLFGVLVQVEHDRVAADRPVPNRAERPAG